MYLSIDEDPISLVSTSTVDFQLTSSGLTQREIINIILTILINVSLASLLILIAF